MTSKYVSNVCVGQKHYSDRLITASNEGDYLRVGKVVRVDYETMSVDIVYIDSVGSAPKLTVTAAFAGYRTFLGGMPSLGDWVVLGYTKSGSWKNPIILQFIPRGYCQGVKNDKVAYNREYVKEGVYKPYRFKMQKLYEGEIYAASKYGSEILLDKNVSISNSKLNEILLKSADQSIALNAVNNYLNSCGTRVSSGLIIRNELIGNPDFLLPGTNIPKFPVYYNEDGIPNYTPTYSDPINVDFPYGRQSLDDYAQGFVEHRLEVKEMADPVATVNNTNSGMDVDSFYKRRADGNTDTPLVVQVFGTLVGNDPYNTLDKKKYGAILKPRIFSSLEDVSGAHKLELCQNGDGKNESVTLAAAYSLMLPKSGTAFYINKQGKVLANIASSSTIDPLGGGESAEINFDGHAKIALGKNDSKGRSLSINTAGGVYTDWGQDNIKNRSWDATFRKGMSWNVMGPDSDKVSWKADFVGDVVHTIKGSRRTVIMGDDVKLVYGVLEDKVFGKKVDNFVNDKATNYGGKYNELAIGNFSQILSAGRSVDIFAPNLIAGGTVADKTEITLGDSEFNMLMGNRKETYYVGDCNKMIWYGKRKVDIVIGSYTVTIGMGDININTRYGDINMKSATGNVTIQGTMGVTIKSAVSVQVQAPKVKIGNLPQGGVVNDGPCGMRCLITGAPHIGSKTVSVNTI